MDRNYRIYTLMGIFAGVLAYRLFFTGTAVTWFDLTSMFIGLTFSGIIMWIWIYNTKKNRKADEVLDLHELDSHNIPEYNDEEFV